MDRGRNVSGTRATRTLQEKVRQMPASEVLARGTIDTALAAAGWCVQDAAAVNLSAGRGVAVREFPLRRGYGFADYLLYVDGKAAGVIEAKREGKPSPVSSRRRRS